MKTKNFFSKAIGSVAMFVTLTSLVSACGGKFNAGTESAEVRPPATSDPKTSLDQRRFESENGQVASTLTTKTSLDTFFEDLTEQKNTHSDEEIVEDAQEQFEQKEKEREEKLKEPVLEEPVDNGSGEEPTSEDTTPEKKPVEQKPATQKPAEQKPTTQKPAEQKPTEQKPTEQKPTTQKPSEQKPVEQKPNPPKVDSKEPVVPPPPTFKEPTAGPTKEPEAQKPTESKPSTSPTNICAGLNVSKGKGVADLSALYNSETKLPEDMPSSEIARYSGQEKKNKFVCVLLPIVIRMSEEVFKQRLEVLRLQAKEKKGVALTAADTKWMTDMKVSYSLKSSSSTEELLKRVDIIPLPLLLAQAALESGWGLSRAARDMNNIFGIHAYKGQDCVQVAGGVCIRRFKSISEGISGYIRLLNAGTHYEDFRNTRARMRANHQPLDSMTLLKAMDDYNENPEKYVTDVREMMTKWNNFTQFIFKEDEVAAN